MGRIRAAYVPMPLQIVIDDVGWWNGTDGHQCGQPYRTGIARRHCIEDYQAIVMLGEKLSMRPQAGMALCEWDRNDILRTVPGSTWMGSGWHNPEGAMPFESVRDFLNGSRDHIELALHAVGHEFWEDGRMSRAEWYSEDGRMRPKEVVQTHLDAFCEIWQDIGFEGSPSSFIPAAFLFAFGDGGDGLAAILRGHGIRFISTPFSMMHKLRQPENKWYGTDCGIMIADRGDDIKAWNDIGAPFAGEVAGPIFGMHWPNILHPDPSRNGEIVGQCAEFIAAIGRRPDRILARSTDEFSEQLLFYSVASVSVGDSVVIGLDPSRKISGRCAVKIESDAECRFSVRGAKVLGEHRECGSTVLRLFMTGEEQTVISPL